MRALLDFRLFSPFGEFFSSKAYLVECDSLDEGRIIVQANHENFNALLKPCLLNVEVDDEKFKTFYIGSGALKVYNGAVNVSAFPIVTKLKKFDFNNQFGFYEAKFLNIWEDLAEKNS